MVSLVLPFTDTGDGVTILILLCALAAVTGFAIATTVLIRRQGIYDPARIELWFRPASGSSPRKGLEKIFRIEGWMA